MKVQQSLSLLLSVLMLICSANMANIYRVIGNTDRERMAVINAAIKEKADCIYIPNYKYKSAQYVYSPVPWPGRIPFFKEFYGIDESVELVFVDVE